MADAYDLSKLGPYEFESIVNFLALKTLGLGHTGFGPGADGGRDGYFEGEAPYPSESARWTGTWYIQSKFHAPSLSANPQKWLREQVSQELRLFQDPQTDRELPDNWIIATNIDPSGKPETGSFDAIRKQVRQAIGGRHLNVAVWGGRKILDLLALHSDVATYYRHFLTPGHLITALCESFSDQRATIEEIIRLFVVAQFTDHTFTKLDQAGSSSDVRPGVHDLFIDLPFSAGANYFGSGLLADLAAAAAQCHRYSLRKQYPESWRVWNSRPRRARVVLVKGGPGQGKSTIGQYLCQIHRAFLILADDGPPVVEAIRDTARAVRAAAGRDGFWPTTPRIPIQIELKEYAQWFSGRASHQSRNVLTYIAAWGAKRLGSEVLAKSIRRALKVQAWIVIFDGLDEVPNDFKDAVAAEVLEFINDVIVDLDADVLAVCTSRPQGYSGQFAGLEGPVVELALLDTDAAMRCARPVLVFGRTPEESQQSIATLDLAVRSPSVKELMTTPLQSHIMAVVVRDGGRPPERRWALFNQFYLVMKKRESLKNFANQRVAKLLQEDRLLKSVHSRLGFVLHARAERSDGAQTTLSRAEFRQLVTDVVTELVEDEIETTVTDVMEATTERLVLVTTPESGEHVRFDIRQLQEFFAAEFLYAGVSGQELGLRIETIGADAHWREVMHFLLSALIEHQRTPELAMAVHVLRRLDDSTDQDASSLLPRRLARSALLASRLLTEGVLEQALKDRQSIRPLLDSLFGVLDLGSLASLGRLSPPRSRQWLIQFLIERLSISAPRENAGALFVLGWLLQGEPALGRTASSAFRNLPVGFQEAVLLRWKGDLPSEHFRVGGKVASGSGLAPWVLDFALDILNSAVWSDFGVEALNALLQICRLSGGRLGNAGSSVRLSPEAGDAVARCLRMTELDAPAYSPRRSAHKFGLVTVSPHSANWINRKVPDALVGFDAGALVAETGGLFRLMLVCAWWAQTQNTEALHELARIMDYVSPQHLATLPGSLLALVPVPSLYSVNAYKVGHLRNISSEEVSALAVSSSEVQQCPTYAGLIVSRVEDATPRRWSILARAFPRIAIDLFFSDHFPWSDSPCAVPELIEYMTANSETSVAHILKWGKLVKLQPILLSALKLSLRGKVPLSAVDAEYRLHQSIHPFELKLPEDAHVLPFLALPLVEWFTGRRLDVYHERPAAAQSIREILSDYGLNERNLRGVVESADDSHVVRAAALSLYWLSLSEQDSELEAQGRVHLDLDREQSLYSLLVNELNESTMAQALVAGVLSHRPETDLAARRMITYLLERCLDGGGPRRELAKLMHIWRERSSAPVHARQVLQRWLGYSFEPPAYSRG